MDVEGRRVHAPEARKTGFREPPEPFNSVDMGGTGNELVLPMIYPKVFPVSDVDEAIIAPPAVGVDDALQGHLSANDVLKGVLGAVGDDLGIDLSVSLEQAEDDGLPERSPAPFPLDPPGTEERLVDFDLSGQGRLFFTVLGDPFPKGLQEPVHRIAVQPCQNSDLGGIQVEGKKPDQLPEFGLRNFRTICILVFYRHD